MIYTLRQKCKHGNPNLAGTIFIRSLAFVHAIDRISHLLPPTFLCSLPSQQVSWEASDEFRVSKTLGKGKDCWSLNGTPLQYSCREGRMDGRAWWAAVHGIARSRTRPRDFTFTFPFHAWEKEMATHSSALAWRIPGTGEPGGLPSMGSHRVGHD